MRQVQLDQTDRTSFGFIDAYRWLEARAPWWRSLIAGAGIPGDTNEMELSLGGGVELRSFVHNARPH